MHQCKCANMSACLFVCLYVYMSVRVFVMYVMYVLSEFLGKDQDSYETSLVNVKSEKCRVNDNEWMTMFPIIRRMCVFLVELLVRAVGCNFLQQKRVEKPRWMRHCTLRKKLQLNYFYLNYGCRSLMTPMFNRGFRWTRRRWQKRTRAQKDVCWAAWARVLAPQHTTSHENMFPWFPMYPLKFPVTEERIQDISGLKKCDRDLSQISPAFIRAVTSVFHPLPSWKRVPRAAGDCCCSLLSWCKLEPKIGLTMINIVLFIIIYYLHIPKSRLLDTWSASEPEMSSKNDPKWLASHYYWPPKNCLLHYLSWLKFIITIHNWSNNDH